MMCYYLNVQCQGQRVNGVFKHINGVFNDAVSKDKIFQIFRFFSTNKLDEILKENFRV